MSTQPAPAVAQSARQTADRAQSGAQRAQESEPVRWSARLGLVAYGVVHLLVGWLALQLAFGDSEGSADNQGALQTLAETPIGRPLLWVLVVGFGALVVWQLGEAATGHTDEDDERKRLAKRAVSVGKAVLFAALAYSSAKVAAGSGSGGGGSTEESLTARLMEQPAGQWLVAAVGLAIIGIGGALAYRGATEGFRKHLGRSATGQSGRAIVTLGKVGYLAKGAALGVLGILVVTAALQNDPQDSGGLDDALRTLLEQPYGSVLVVIVGAGLAAYGVFCFARARDLRSQG